MTSTKHKNKTQKSKIQKQKEKLLFFTKNGFVVVKNEDSRESRGLPKTSE